MIERSTTNVELPTLTMVNARERAAAAKCSLWRGDLIYLYFDRAALCDVLSVSAESVDSESILDRREEEGRDSRSLVNVWLQFVMSITLG